MVWRMTSHCQYSSWVAVGSSPFNSRCCVAALVTQAESACRGPLNSRVGWRWDEHLAWVFLPAASWRWSPKPKAPATASKRRLPAARTPRIGLEDAQHRVLENAAVPLFCLLQGLLRQFSWSNVLYGPIEIEIAAPGVGHDPHIHRNRSRASILGP